MTRGRIHEIMRSEGLRLTFGTKVWAEGTNIQINEAMHSLIEYKAPASLHVLELEDDGCSAIAEVIYLGGDQDDDSRTESMMLHGTEG